MKYSIAFTLLLSSVIFGCNGEADLAKYTKRVDDAAASYKKQTDSLQILINKAALDRKNAKTDHSEATAIIREIGLRNEQMRYELLELDSIQKIK